MFSECREKQDREFEDLAKKNLENYRRMNNVDITAKMPRTNLPYIVDSIKHIRGILSPGGKVRDQELDDALNIAQKIAEKRARETAS
jgi:hypothetical protein